MLLLPINCLVASERSSGSTEPGFKSVTCWLVMSIISFLNPLRVIYVSRITLPSWSLQARSTVISGVRSMSGLKPAGRADTGAWLLISSTTSPILLTFSSASSTRSPSFSVSFRISSMALSCASSSSVMAFWLMVSTSLSPRESSTLT